MERERERGRPIFIGVVVALARGSAQLMGLPGSIDAEAWFVH